MPRVIGPDGFEYEVDENMATTIYGFLKNSGQRLYRAGEEALSSPPQQMPPDVSSGQLGSPAAAQEVQEAYQQGGAPALNPGIAPYGIMPVSQAPGAMRDMMTERRRALDEAAGL